LQSGELIAARQQLVQSESQRVAGDQLLQSLRSELSSLQNGRDNTRQAVTQLEAELSRLRQLRDEDQSRLSSLQGEYDEMNVEYKKLLRPARSSKGKHVVSVWLSKAGGRSTYRIRDGDSGSFTTVSLAQMKSQLESAKQKYGKQLYVKVIIPENSGLSYNEAWRFTNDMQRAYDYYYQGE